jgi:hypothetical protein
MKVIGLGSSAMVSVAVLREALAASEIESVPSVGGQDDGVRPPRLREL